MTATIERSTFSDNQSDAAGGALCVWNSETLEVVITNSTFSHNSAMQGGAIYGYAWTSTPFTLRHSTVTGNTGGGVRMESDFAFTLGHSIVSGNSGTDVYASGGAFVSAGYNLVGSLEGTIMRDGWAPLSTAFLPALDLVNVSDPGLSPLADHGGETWTHTPQAGSPALDGGYCAETAPAADQRGLPRIGGATCDIGAVEWQHPLVLADTASTAEDTPVAIPVLTNDSSPEGAVLSLTGADSDDGVAAVNGEDVIYTPTLNFNGETVLRYTVSDGVATGMGHITVTVTPGDDPLTVTDDVVTVVQGKRWVIPVLDNDDPDGNASLVDVTASAHGTAARVGRTVHYTATAAFLGQDSFTYTATDGVTPGTASVTVTVIADRPVTAVDDVAMTALDTPVAIYVLANDSDPDGDGTLAAVGIAEHGAVEISGEYVTYTPPAGYRGLDVFTYTLADGAFSDTAVVTVAVSAIVVTSPLDNVTRDGVCTLREAIHAANHNWRVDTCLPGQPGRDVIFAPVGVYTLTLTGTGEDGNLTGDLDILEDLALYGASTAATVVEGNGFDRVFHIAADVAVILGHLTVRGRRCERFPGEGGRHLQPGRAEPHARRGRG